MDGEAVRVYIQPEAWDRIKQVLAEHLPVARVNGPYHDDDTDDESGEWYAITIPLVSPKDLVINPDVVYAALPEDGTPIRAIDLAGVLGYRFGAEPASHQTRTCLQSLAEHGKAQVIYGSGWRRLPA